MSDRSSLLTDADFFPLKRALARRAELKALRERLKDLGYSEESVVRVLAIEGPYAVGPLGRQVWARYNLTDDEATHVLVRVFLLGLPEDQQVLGRFLNPDELALLHDLRLLVPVGSKLVCPVTLYPIGDLYIATDWWFEPDKEARRSPTRVMPLGRDSFGLARLAASRSDDAGLDLCTGSGVIALKIAAGCDRVIGTDINPRAINFAQFNAMLNGIENCEFIVGDLFQPVADRRFDLITANPPFVPTPAVDVLLYRDGGSSGEEILRRVVGGCREHLEEQGTCLIATDLVQHRNVPYEEKIRSWLGGKPGFATVLFEAPRMSSYQYASEHASHPSKSDVSPEIFRWLDHYLAEGIESVAHGYIAINRDSYEENPVVTFQVPSVFERDVPPGFVAGLFSRLHDVDALGVSDLRLLPAYDLGQVDLVGDPLELKGFRLPYLVANALAALRDRSEDVSLSSLIGELRKAGYAVGPEREAELANILRHLFVAGYLIKASNDSLDGFNAVQSRRRTARKLWWSQ